MDNDTRDKMIYEMHAVLLGANGDPGLVGYVHEIDAQCSKNRANINKILGGLAVISALAGSAITLSITI